MKFTKEQHEGGKLNKKMKVFFILLFLLLLLSLAATFYKFILLKDFQVIAETHDIKGS